MIPDFFNFQNLDNKLLMDLVYFLKVLYRKKWVIMALSLLAVITTFLLLINNKSQFSSTAQYSTGFTSERVKLADGTSTLDLYTIDLKFDNVIETMKSPEVISRISYSLLIHDLASPSLSYKKLSEKERKMIVLKVILIDTVKNVLSQKLALNELLRPGVKTEEYVLEYLKLYGYDYRAMLENLLVNRVARTDYLDISFSSMNSNLSAFVVNSIGVEFLNYYKGLSKRRTDENALNIKDLLRNQQNKVDSLGQLMLGEKISQGTIDPLSRTTSAMETVTELESRLADERGKYNEHFNRHQYLNTKLISLQGSLSSGNGNNSTLTLINKRNDLVEQLNRKGGSDAELEKQISDLRLEINSKTSGGGNKVKAKESIDELTTQVNEENALINASKSTIKEYETSIARYMGMTDRNPGSEIKIKVIQTQLDMENKQLSNLKEISNQIAGLAKDDPTSNFLQTRMGQAAIEPNSKRILLKMALSGFSILFLSSVFFLFLEIFDSSVKTPGIFNKLTKLKIATVINMINLKRKNAATIIQDEGTGRKFIRENIFKNNIRKLRFELLNSGNKVFLFTSAQNGTGKSTIIEALATSLTHSNKKVLIMDMNFSNNSLTRFFETNVYIQDVMPQDIQQLNFEDNELAGKTPYTNIYIIGCIERNTTPFEIFNSHQLNAFISQVKDKYDFILLEGAALNNYADSKELALSVDAVFTVFSADNAVTQIDKISNQFIAELKGKHYGVILNKVLTENINL